MSLFDKISLSNNFGIGHSYHLNNINFSDLFTVLFENNIGPWDTTWKKLLDTPQNILYYPSGELNNFDPLFATSGFETSFKKVVEPKLHIYTLPEDRYHRSKFKIPYYRIENSVIYAIQLEKVNELIYDIINMEPVVFTGNKYANNRYVVMLDNVIPLVFNYNYIKNESFAAISLALSIKIKNTVSGRLKEFRILYLNIPDVEFIQNLLEKVNYNSVVIYKKGNDENDPTVRNIIQKLCRRRPQKVQLVSTNHNGIINYPNNTFMEYNWDSYLHELEC